MTVFGAGVGAFGDAFKCFRPEPVKNVTALQSFVMVLVDNKYVFFILGNKII